ncbi:ferredoxin--NADP reductase [Mycolicibacterium rufum]|uniref:Ferredoxin--NADP reductase n=1 Tax=Mycolicibacterium rufum TaxID=318424 RepID=A0A9X2YGL1_9MYCO|nr:ferredoxin--NADP reductase [Mycolicibacterium rufum]KGI69163.1 ferredoxin [Mycolicibacterium rufum]MCV7072950.1 ferredoxin--NADP reductase [Mycolicibacterium rufum]ULP35349.1 ferredoxin--NADP reductase [Mycolicibacterium rufum]
MSDATSADAFAPLRIKRVVRETADAVSLVLDVPEHCSARYRYRAGQYLTLQVHIEGRALRRCYSMSSAPADDELQITVKRDPGGVVSNWLNDIAAEGDEVHAAPPEGRFVLRDGTTESEALVAFAGGSGITPIMSLVRTVLADSTRPVALFYANRAPESVIFSDVLAALADRHPDRLTVVHHHDCERGVVTPAAVESFVGGIGDADYYICGPAPFIDTVASALSSRGIGGGRVHLERFTAAQATDAVDQSSEHACQQVLIDLDRRRTIAAYRAGNTLLQTARLAGLQAPYSCETGSCGTCMARVDVGSARMLNNDALDDDEVAEGWVLTCQALPTSREVHVVYE